MCISKVYDGDTYFHIKIGEKILKNGIFYIDTFSMHSNLKYISYAYLFDIIIYLFYNLFGFLGITIFKYLFILIFFSIYYKVLFFINKNKTLSLLLSGSIITIMSDVIVGRPHIMSYLFLVIQIYIIIKYFENKNIKILYFLPITFLILGNLHSDVVPLHLLVVAIFSINYINIKNKKIVINKDIFKYLLIIFIATIFALINPYFPNNVLYSLKTLDDSYMMLVQEWNSPILYSILGMLVIIPTVIVTRIYKIKTTPIPYLLIYVVVLFLSIKSVRFIPYLLIIFGFILAYTFKNYKLVFGNIFKNKIVKRIILVLAICFILILLVAKISNNKNYVFENSKNDNPVAAVNYIKKHKIIQVFNEYNYGSYLLFYDIKPFIDTRGDLYSSNYNNTTILKDLVDVYYLNTSPYKIFKKYNIKYALIKKDSTYYIINIKPYIKKYKILYKDNEYILIMITSY